LRDKTNIKKDEKIHRNQIMNVIENEIEEEAKKELKQISIDSISEKFDKIILLNLK
jgi:hypothetical protein